MDMAKANECRNTCAECIEIRFGGVLIHKSYCLINFWASFVSVCWQADRQAGVLRQQTYYAFAYFAVFNLWDFSCIALIHSHRARCCSLDRLTPPYPENIGKCTIAHNHRHHERLMKEVTWHPDMTLRQHYQQTLREWRRSSCSSVTCTYDSYP